MTRHRRLGIPWQILSLPGAAELASTHQWTSPDDDATFRQSLRNLVAIKGRREE